MYNSYNSARCTIFNHGAYSQTVTGRRAILINLTNSFILKKNILNCLISLASCKVSFLQLTKSKHFVFSTDCTFCDYMDLGDCNCDDVKWCREVQCTVPEKCDEACKNFVIHLLNNLK